MTRHNFRILTKYQLSSLGLDFLLICTLKGQTGDRVAPGSSSSELQLWTPPENRDSSAPFHKTFHRTTCWFTSEGLFLFSVFWFCFPMKRRSARSSRQSCSWLSNWLQLSCSAQSSHCPRAPTVPERDVSSAAASVVVYQRLWWIASHSGTLHIVPLKADVVPFHMQPAPPLKSMFYANWGRTWLDRFPFKLVVQTGSPACKTDSSGYVIYKKKQQQKKTLGSV